MLISSWYEAAYKWDLFLVLRNNTTNPAMSIANFGGIKFRTEKFHEASTYRLLYGVECLKL